MVVSTWQRPPQVYSPFRPHRLTRPMAVPVAAGASTTRPGRAWWRLVRALFQWRAAFGRSAVAGPRAAFGRSALAERRAER